MSTRNQGFVLREDAALKAHLQGIRVNDATSPPEGREVPVYFRLPEQEARRRNYPYVTIDLLNIARDPSREHRGLYNFHPESAYVPPGRIAGDRAKTSWPIPMSITYQVTSFTRFVQHDRQILTALMLDKLPNRFGSLVMADGEGYSDDGSVRRLDVVSGPITADTPDPSDPNKRIFRKAYTVQVSSEIFLSEIRRLALVDPDKVLIDLHDLQDPSVVA